MSSSAQFQTQAQQQRALWMQFCSFRASAQQYAAAVRLWGLAAASLPAPPWPPCDNVLLAFAGVFRNGDSLAKYLSHIRSVLAWFGSPAGALSNTDMLVRGGIKATPSGARRQRVRASGEQTRLLVKWACDKIGKEMGAAWSVTRLFCLRYAETLSLGTDRAPVACSTSPQGRRRCEITLLRRKCCREPVVIPRNCVCDTQGRVLCGVCWLHELGTHRPVFANLSYAESLATLTLGAGAFGFSELAAWSTHAFRRGYATEALAAGGPSALFHAGGWRGVAAFSYPDELARGRVLHRPLGLL